MSISSKAGQFTVAISDTGTKTITGVGFTADVVIFWAAFQSVVSANTELNTSFGAMTSSAQWCAYTNRRTTALLGIESNISTTGVIESGAGRLTYNAINSDGFVLNIGTQFTSETATINYLALGGSSIDAAVGTVTGPTSTGNFSVTGLAFQPNALIAAASSANSSPASVTIGMATGTSNEGSLGWATGGWGPTDHAMSRNDAIISGYDGSGLSNTFPVSEFVAFTSDGFTLNRTAANTGTTAHVHAYVAIRASGGAAVTNSSAQTTTGADSIGTTSAAPSALIAMSLTSVAVNTEGGPAKVAVGFVDSGGGMAGTAFHAAMDNTTANFQKEHYTTHVLKQISSAAAVEGSVAWQAWESTGVSLNTDDAFPTAGQITTLMLVAGAPTISSTSDTNKLIDESSFVITGTGLTSATAVTFKQTGRPDYNATAFITANNSTTVTLTGLDVQDMSMAYGAATVAVTTSGGTSADFAITIQEQSGHTKITLSGLDSSAEWLGLTSANGDQRLAATTTAKGGTFAFVGVDGNWTITYPGSAKANDSIYMAEFDDSANQWYESSVTINSADDGLSRAVYGMRNGRRVLLKRIRPAA